MVNLVLDTNILVSALWSSNGNPARVIEQILYGEAGFYLSEDILKEYNEVLNRPKLKFKQELVQNLLNGLLDCGNIVVPKHSSIILPDESDRKFYDVAKSTNSFLISGNLKHFPIEPFIMSPVEYLNMVR